MAKRRRDIVEADRAVQPPSKQQKRNLSVESFDDGDDLMARALEMQDDGLQDSDSEEEGSLDDQEQEVETNSDEEEEEQSNSISEDVVAGDEDWTQVGPASNGPNGSSMLRARAETPVEDSAVKTIVNIKQLADTFVFANRVASISSVKNKALAATLETLQTFLPALSNVGPFSLSEGLQYVKKHGVSIPLPLPEPAGDVKWKVAFEAPSSVRLGGYWPLKMALKARKATKWFCDLHVEMPSSLFQENDIKDHRYFHKRAFYLAALAIAVQTRSPSLRCTFAYLDDDELRPIIQLEPVNNVTETDFAPSKCIIRLIPCIEISTSPFVLSKLGPQRNNIRTKTETDLQDTPYYNSSLLLDLLQMNHHSHLQEVVLKAPFFPDTCILLQSWASRFTSVHNRLSMTIARFMVFTLAYLLTGPHSSSSKKGRGQLPVGANSWVLFKGTLDFIVKHDFQAEPVVLAGDKLDASHFDATAFDSRLRGVLIDRTGLVNLLQSVSLARLNHIRFEANLTLSALESDTEEGFNAVFRSEPSLLRYDASAILNIPAEVLQKKATVDGTVSQTLSQLHQVLSQALGTRVKGVFLSDVTASTWDTATKSSLPHTSQIELGLWLDASQAGRLVDHGPHAEDDSACREFRSFWGPKSELRRFKDGSITESVIWEADTPLARSSIIGQIIQYILQKQFGISKNYIRLFVGAFDDMLTEPIISRKLLYQSDPNVRSYGGVMDVFETLSNKLRSLDGLPLAIKNVSACSESLRYASVFVPGPRKTKQFFTSPEASRFIPMTDIILTFETSGHWPDDLEAVQKVKAAFLQRIANLLLDGMPHSQCSIAFDLDSSPTTDNVALEILLSEGYAFRARIHHERERTLLSQLPMTAPEEIQLVQTMLKDYNLRFVARPKHHSAILALQRAYPSLSTGIRLVKRWFRAHLLSPHVTPEFCELLVVAAFLDAPMMSCGVPATGASGFIRVLQLLRDWLWIDSPLYIPLYTAIDGDVDLTKGKRLEFPVGKATRGKMVFDQTRKKDSTLVGGGAMVLVTEEDLGGKHWGWENPSPMVAARIQVLAQATLSALEVGLADEQFKAETLFHTPLTDYDFLIHLNPAQLTRMNESLSSEQAFLSSKPLVSNLASVLPTPPIRLGYDPASAFVGQLQKLLGDAAVLLHDLHGGPVIAGLFNPALDKAREWRVMPHSLPMILVPVQGKKKHKVKLDRAGVLSEISILGGELIRSVEMAKK